MEKAKANLKAKKCEFAVRETSFLGHVVNGDEIKMQESKIKDTLEWPTPTYRKVPWLNWVLPILHQGVHRFIESIEPKVKRKKVYIVKGRRQCIPRNQEKIPERSGLRTI